MAGGLFVSSCPFKLVVQQLLLLWAAFSLIQKQTIQSKCKKNITHPAPPPHVCISKRHCKKKNNFEQIIAKPTIDIRFLCLLSPVQKYKESRSSTKILFLSGGKF